MVPQLLLDTPGGGNDHRAHDGVHGGCGCRGSCWTYKIEQIERAHLVDGAGALAAHVQGKQGEYAHAQQRHPDQAGNQKSGRFVLHPAAPS